ncbi:MAG TPA: transporter substrate-binding domain-containing protein [Firmicutes bacterium]|nr:transporter substrate-binding domain-containing protein [Bacillota bacterium]
MKKIIALAIICAAVLTLFAGCKKNEAAQIGSAADLVDKRIGVQEGTTGESYVQDNVEGAKLSSYKSGMDAALALKNGQLDAVVLDELPAQEIVKQNDDLKILDESLTTESYAIAVRKGDTELLNSINATLKRIKEDGTFEKFTNAFMPASGEIEVLQPKETSGDTIKMGTNAAFKPFEYLEGSDIVGFDICLSAEIAADAGKKLEVVNMDFNALITALSSGTVDFVAAGMTADAERMQSVDFSDPYYDATQVIIVKK